jgi:hypothetical protein
MKLDGRSDESLVTKEANKFAQHQMEAGVHSGVEQEFYLWQPLR